MSFFSKIIPPLYQHQKEDVEFYLSRDSVFNTADPGTGKTRTVIEMLTHRHPTKRGRTLILCPKSICQAAWGNDIQKFSNLSYGIAAAENRLEPFLDKDVEVVITNHDAARTLKDKLPKLILDGFNTLIVDESTAFKNHAAKRSKELVKLGQQMQYKSCLTGTPTPNGILDLWNQLFILDQGTRLGTSYYQFRMATCEPRPIGRTGITQWVAKPGIESVIGQMIQDITIRRRLEDCIDLPEQVFHTYHYTPNAHLTQHYETLRHHSLLELTNDRSITAVHAAAVLTKLLQLLSGAVYDNESYSLLDTARYELVLDLIEERQHSLCTFNWKHQRDLLTQCAEKRKLPFAVIDGSTPGNKRNEIVDRYQNGEFRVLFAHPQSTGHGLTLTRGTSIIWSSPTYNLEHFAQFNRRIYRAGQNQKTEVLMVHTPNTVEDRVYAKLMQKQALQLNLLELLL